MAVVCPNNHENVEGAFFCDVCGAALYRGSFPAQAALVLQDGTRFPLEGQTEFTVGRADPTSESYPDVDLTRHGGEEGGVSRVHLKIRLARGKFTIEDQNSVNFTFLNKQKLNEFEEIAVKNGDEIRLGRIIVTFEAP